MDNGPGWLPDPEDDSQERYWSGSEWTDRVRPAGRGSSLRLPEHVPELQRALAAATADIDAVEDRLSNLFERTDAPARPPAASPAAAPSAPDSERGAEGAPPPPTHPEFTGRSNVPGEEDDAAFTELDAALASEEPADAGEPEEDEKPKRGLFRRRS